MSDALGTETDRGRVTRIGWGRYQLTRPLTRSSRSRIRRHLQQHRNNLAHTYKQARRALTEIWTHTLADTNLVPGLVLTPGDTRPIAQFIIILHRTQPKVASPTGFLEKESASSPDTPHDNPRKEAKRGTQHPVTAIAATSFRPTPQSGPNLSTPPVVKAWGADSLTALLKRVAQLQAAV